MSRAGRARAAREAEEIVRRARRPRGRELKAEWECGMTWSGGERQRAAAHLAPDTKHPGKHHKFDLFKSLHQLYDELCREESLHNTYQGLKTTSYLLEKLLARVNLNTLIINLYPGNKGYSLSLKVNGNTQELFPSDVNEEETVETARWPYEEEELLSHIDNEELPVVLLDLLEADHSSLFYSGCVVAQVRDFRQAYPNFLCDTHHVLLRPTNQSILRDCAGVTGRCGLGGEERAALEAALVLATAPPLCLDPRPALGLLAARLHSAPRLLNTPRIRRQARRFSQVSVNRKRKLEAWSRAHGLELLELVGRQRARQPGRHPAAHHRAAHHDRLTSKYPKRPPDVLKGVEGPRVECPVLGVPSEPGAALRLARAHERGRVSQDCAAQLVEEYVLETERAGGGGVFHIKLSILQRPSDQEFLGELYVDRDHVDGERNGAACRFTLGSRVHANKYIQQFTEIFTEEGRKSVRIKHAVPGQPSRISFTPACREQTQQLVLQQRPGSAVSAPAPAPSPGSAPVPSPPVVTSSAGAGAGAAAPARSLPVLQAQLAGGVGAGAGAGAAVDMQQPSPGQAAHRHSPQVGAGSAVELPGGAGAGGGGGGANQLLAAQLTNPPQPLNPSKLPASAVLHIQHPAATHRLITSTQAGGAGVTAARPRTTNPAISALVTSLMNSAHQFQQQANQNAGKPVASSVCGNNATILNLLNSAPAAMTHPTTVASDNYTRHQVLSGYGAGGAGEEAGGEASLLERLMSGGGGEAGEPEAAPAPAPAPAPPQALQLQGLSLASLQGLGVGVGVQNVQVQIPGLAAPISLSLNVSGAGGGLLVSVPPTTSVVLHNQPSVLSLPIAQLMSSGVKGGVRGGVQLVRARAPAAPQPRPLRPLAAPLLAAAPAAAAASAAPLQTAAGGGGAQFLTQAQQQTLAQQLRRKPSTDGPQQQ